MVFFLRFVKFNNCSLNLLFVVHLDNPKTLKNPCTLEPTDFQLYRKMKRKFYFRFSFFFAAKKRNWTSIFVFHFFPAGKETESEFTLCSPFFLFCNFWKHGFSFSFWFFGFLVFWFFGFLVFRFRMELGKRITSRFPFLANGSETDNLCLSGEYLGN